MANKNKTLGQVQKYIAREQYDRAIKLLLQLVEEDPNDVRSLLKLGDVYVKKGERDVAVDVYKRVAKQYSEQGFFMKAVAIYKQILKHQNKNVEALMQLAELYEHLGLASEARQQYLLAESVLQESGDAGAALALMQKQVELDPDNVAHRIKLAEAYSSHDNVAAATRQFAAAAEVLRRQNREEDFIKVAERLVYHDPNRPEILRDLARLYLSRGDAKRALAKLQLCFRSQPKDVETLELLAQAFSELRQYTRTKTVYQELVQVLEDKGLIGKAEEYRLLIRQLDEADRPTPAPGSPAPAVASFIEGLPESENGLGHPVSDFDGAAEAVLAATPPPPPDAPLLNPPPPPPEAFNGVHADPTGGINGAISEAESPSVLDDLIIEPPVESGDVAMTAPPPPPASPEASVEQQVANLVRDARVYQRYNLPAGAMEQLQRALELDAENIDVLDQMRELYINEGDTARAADAVAEMVRVHYRNGDRDSAEHAKQQIAMLMPSHPLAVSALADELPAVGGTNDQREDSLSFVITEDSGAFEIVDVAESGAEAAAFQTSDVDAIAAAADEIEESLPEPQFANEQILAEDDEPIHPFNSDLQNHPMDHDGAVNGHGYAHGGNGALHSDIAFGAPYGDAPEHEAAEDPTTLGEPLSEIGGDQEDPFDLQSSENNEPLASDLPPLPDPMSAAALGSPAGMPDEEPSVNEAEPITAHATSPGGVPDLTDELAEVQFFLDVGDEEGAQEALRELIDAHPNHPEVLALAMALNVDASEEPKNPANRVTSEDVQAAFDKALDEEVSDDDPSEVQDAYDQGMALMEIERTAQAIEAFERAAEWPSMAATAREMLVRCYAKMDQPAQAVAHFRDAESHGVSGAAATHLKYLIAACYERTGDLAQALEWYEECAADDPSHLDVQEQVSRVALLVYGAAQGDEVGSSTDRRNKISYL